MIADTANSDTPKSWVAAAYLPQWNDDSGQTAENVANELFNFADAMRAKGEL